MTREMISSLSINAALLFALSSLYGAFNFHPTKRKWIGKSLMGVLIGCIAVILMLNPWYDPANPAIFYDTRSVLISISGAFFGVISTVIAAIFALVYRISVGGDGVYAGSLSIVTPAILGLLWHYLPLNRWKIPYAIQYLLFGIASTALMLLSQLALMPWPYGVHQIATIGPTVMLIYPALTSIIAVLILNQQKRLMAQKEIRRSEEMLKAGIDSPSNTTILAIDTNYNYLFFNEYHRQYMASAYGVSIEKGMNILDAIRVEPDRTYAKANYDRIFAGESFVLTQPFGTLVTTWFEANYSPIYDDTKKLIGLTAVARDVTEKVRLEEAYRASEAKNSQLINTMIQGLAVHEIILNDKGIPIDYRFIDVNESFEKITGLKKADIVGKTVLEVLPGTEHEWIEKYGQVALTGEPIQFQSYAKELDKYFELSAFSPQPMQFAVIVTDISDRIKMIIKLENSERKLQSAIEGAPVAIMMHAEDGEIITVNDTWTKITGYTIEDIPRIEQWFRLAYARVPTKLGMKMKDYFASTTRKLDGEYTIRTKTGANVIWEIYSAIIGTTDDGRKIAMNVAIDITERKQKDAAILFLNYHDPLTGLYNRRYYEQTIKEIQVPENMPLSAVMADINGLKIVNDAFGHSAGDQLLLRVTDTFNRFCREADIIARIGGDEFVLIMPKTSHAEALKIIDSITSEMDRTTLFGVHVSVSLGLATKISDDTEIDIIKDAEIDMYNKKLAETSSKRSETIKTILATLHLKNPREEVHSRRVSELCHSIGEILQMRKDQLNLLKIMGNLHDIGKIAIDEVILNKPGKLTDDEWAKVKRHPEIGYRILATAVEYADIAEDILAHHERWDGLGYPKGIKGEDIPVRARIIAIADAYDAMTSSRPYRPALSDDVAAAEIIKNAGTQFDPDIAKKFVTDYLHREWTR